MHAAIQDRNDRNGHGSLPPKETRAFRLTASLAIGDTYNNTIDETQLLPTFQRPQLRGSLPYPLGLGFEAENEGAEAKKRITNSAHCWN